MSVCGEDKKKRGKGDWQWDDDVAQWEPKSGKAPLLTQREHQTKGWMRYARLAVTKQNKKKEEEKTTTKKRYQRKIERKKIKLK